MIAKECGKTSDSMESFVKLLEENWIDTQETYASLTAEILKELEIPLMLIKKIMEKVVLVQKMPTSNAKNQQQSMQNQTFIQKQLYVVAIDCGKTPGSIDPFVKLLEDNWVDTQQSFVSLTVDFLKELKFPLMLIYKIIERVAFVEKMPPSTNKPQTVQNQSKPQQSTQNQFKPQQNTQNQNKPQQPVQNQPKPQTSQNNIKPPQNVQNQPKPNQNPGFGSPPTDSFTNQNSQNSKKSITKNSNEDIGKNPQQIKKAEPYKMRLENESEATTTKDKLVCLQQQSYGECMGANQMMAMLDIMRKLIENPINDPSNKNYRKIKRTNPKVFETVTRHESNVRFFVEIGFLPENDEFLVMDDYNYNKANLVLAQNVIFEYAEKTQKLVNSIGQSHTSSTTGFNNADQANKMGSGIGTIPQQLEALKAKRRVMIKPLADRKVK